LNPTGEKFIPTVDKTTATVNKTAATVNKTTATVNKTAATVNISFLIQFGSNLETKTHQICMKLLTYESL